MTPKELEEHKTAQSTPSPRILIVEDEPMLSKATARYLQRHLNAVCDIVEWAESAIALINAGAAYDAVVCDWNLEGQMDGDSVWLAMKARGIDAKFVFYTSEEAKARRLHHAVVVKPSPMDDLLKLVGAAIAADVKPIPPLVILEAP